MQGRLRILGFVVDYVLGWAERWRCMAAEVKAEPCPPRAINKPQLWQGSASLCWWLSKDLLPSGEPELTLIGLGCQERLVGS